MGQRLYDLMNWAGIEELVYSEASNPHAMLKPHLTEEGLLTQALVPTAAEISAEISSTGEKYPMELTDKTGFFVTLIPRKSRTPYTLVATYDNGVTEGLYDPYSSAPQYREEDLKEFAAGTHYTVYEKMGAHPMTIDRVSGVYFSVQTPCAMRVNVVEDFSLWDGGRHQIRHLGGGGGSVFKLFIPGLHEGEIYKYEVKIRARDPMLKADPHTNCAELHPNSASIVWNVGKYKWSDKS